jgi:hypothetical protein
MKNLSSIRSLAIRLAVLSFCFIYQQSTAGASSIQDSTESTASDAQPRQKILKNRLLFPHGKVLMILPKRPNGEPMLRPFTVDEFDRHYGISVKPEFAFIDDSTDSRISISVTQTKLAPDELSEYKDKLEKAIARSVKDIIWHKREILKFGDVEWAHLEMQNITSDEATVMNDFYVTSMGGHPLMFTITANTRHWYEVRKLTQKMMLSVTIQDIPQTSDK